MRSYTQSINIAPICYRLQTAIKKTRASKLSGFFPPPTPPTHTFVFHTQCGKMLWFNINVQIIYIKSAWFCIYVCICVCVFHVLQVSRLRFVYNFEVRYFVLYFFFCEICIYLKEAERILNCPIHFSCTPAP